jgi:EAL domain-containing protein (putative c-di-GMP-specific phosphodiesterase class I)
VSPSQLDVEVTERAMVENTAMLDDAADRLAKLGVGLSLDDFGTGYAALPALELVEWLRSRASYV